MPPMRPSVSGSGRRESDCTDKGERPQSFRLLNFSRSDVDAHSTDSSTQYIWRHLTNTQQLSSTAVASPHHILQERLDPRQAQPMNESKSQVRQEKGFKRQSMNALNRLRRRWSKGHRSSKVIPEHTLIDESEGEVSAVGTPTMHHAS
ncbi:hypothetical protein EV182_004544 [Spiromyces aspiralis]|uniref:Uncharacterized protein n=1 Tax=Spiromyces aspiralis TaxID=68401 RepID=A0ACC1HIQ3_9FUNG|nr:hypothetical protein EV182_004544 [Spiromyces aspiralis]